MKKLTLASAFSGIGGFELGLAGFAQPIWACDINKFANETYFNNFGLLPSLDLWTMPHDVDIFTAGFPCQPFSKAGKQTGEAHELGQMWEVVVDLIVERRPKYFILENVPELLHSPVFAKMKLALPVKLYAGTICSADLGIPMRRTRAFITNFPWEPPARIARERPVKDVLTSPFGRIYYNIDRLINGAIDGKSGSQGYRVYSEDDPAPSISKRMRFLVSNGEQIFRPSIREYYNVFGFPQSFKIHPKISKAMEQVGNTIVPACVEHIGRQMPND